MHIHQFSIQPTTTDQEIKELQQLRLLKDGEVDQLDPAQLWLTFLTRIHTSSQEPLAIRQWLHDILATPDQAVDDWLADDEPLTTDIFYLVAFQLLQYEPAVDFNLQRPFKDWVTIGLPYRQHTVWSTTDVVDALYLLLNTRTKNGQIFLDQLTSEGFLAWTYDLPADQKPLFFNGKPVACFDPAKFIREVVYVETDLDTDFDGQADLVKAEIMRPADTEDGLQVPTVFTASPYNQGTNDEWGDISTHHVNHPLTHKESNYQAPAEMTFPKKAKHQLVTGHAKEATESFATTPAYTLNNYLAVRGYAIVYAAGIGTKDSDGLQTCGSPEQTNSMKAVVEWLHGDRRAFTDRHSGIEISAWWCNGNVAMTGRSYLGTLSTAVATTGVAGLKAIISEAAISSWYDYYRENGLVRAAGGFQGEDADTLADETFSRTKRPADYQRIKDTYQRYTQQMAKEMDRQTGNYNAFWDARNYRHDISGIKCAVMMVHGLNDTNVKPSNVKALYDGLQQLPVTSKLILHQGQHIYINAFQSLDFSEMVNLWLANKLWAIENHADQLLPNVLVQDNVSPEKWTAYDQWTAESRQWFLNGNQLTAEPLADQPTQSFDDQQTADKYQAWCQSPAQWQQALLKDDGQFSRHFTTSPANRELLLRGTPHLTIKVASSVDHGLLSAALVDLGTARRLTTSPVLMNRGGLQLGFHWATDDLREFQLQKRVTSAKVISRGHINLQNRHSAAHSDDLAADQLVTVAFDLQPLFHRLARGHRLALIVYGTDYEFTLRGNEAIKYTLDVNDARLTIE